MKYCILIIDGASGLPLPDYNGKTCLELAKTPDVDCMAHEGILGLARTVPLGMEPSSACACMSVLGYDPKVFYRGRASIEARSMGIPVDEGDAVFRCNLVAVRDGKMWDYSSGHISTDESRILISSLNASLSGERVQFYPGISYRHICKLKGHEDTILAAGTPPHDISGKPIAGYLPRGVGSELLKELMVRSEDVLRDHPVNTARQSRGEVSATTIWLFWGTGRLPDMPDFKQTFGLTTTAMTSGVDLLGGLAIMMGIEVLDIKGVTDGPDNDYAGQVIGALRALETRDMVVIHIESPDEAAHAGSVDGKIEALQRIDREVISRIRSWQGDALRVLVMPDHATPIKGRTHTDDPVPFLLWGPGFDANGAKRFTEAEAKSTDVFLEEGYKIMGRLVGK